MSNIVQINTENGIEIDTSAKMHKVLEETISRIEKEDSSLSKGKIVNIIFGELMDQIHETKIKTYINEKEETVNEYIVSKKELEDILKHISSKY